MLESIVTLQHTAKQKSQTTAASTLWIRCGFLYRVTSIMPVSLGFGYLVVAARVFSSTPCVWLFCKNNSSTWEVDTMGFSIVNIVNQIPHNSVRPKSFSQHVTHLGFSAFDDGMLENIVTLQHTSMCFTQSKNPKEEQLELSGYEADFSTGLTRIMPVSLALHRGWDLRIGWPLFIITIRWNPTGSGGSPYHTM